MNSKDKSLSIKSLLCNEVMKIVVKYQITHGADSLGALKSESYLHRSEVLVGKLFSCICMLLFTHLCVFFSELLTALLFLTLIQCTLTGREAQDFSGLMSQLCELV